MYVCACDVYENVVMPDSMCDVCMCVCLICVLCKCVYECECVYECVMVGE